MWNAVFVFRARPLRPYKLWGRRVLFSQNRRIVLHQADIPVQWPASLQNKWTSITTQHSGRIYRNWVNRHPTAATAAAATHHKNLSLLWPWFVYHLTTCCYSVDSIWKEITKREWIGISVGERLVSCICKWASVWCLRSKVWNFVGSSY